MRKARLASIFNEQAAFVTMRGVSGMVMWRSVDTVQGMGATGTELVGTKPHIINAVVLCSTNKKLSQEVVSRGLAVPGDTGFQYSEAGVQTPTGLPMNRGNKDLGIS
jgi:hypothetical protein